MRYVIPALIISGVIVWVANLRQRGEPIGPALERVARRWGPVVLAGTMAYLAVQALLMLVTIAFALFFVYLIFGALTGGLIWQSGGNEAFTALSLVLLVAILVFVGLVIFGLVMTTKLLRRRLHTPAPAYDVAPPPPPPPPPPSPATHGEAPPEQTRPRRERPLRAAGR